jgi:hypothetical protein
MPHSEYRPVSRGIDENYREGIHRSVVLGDYVHREEDGEHGCHPVGKNMENATPARKPCKKSGCRVSLENIAIKSQFLFYYYILSAVDTSNLSDFILIVLIRCKI